MPYYHCSKCHHEWEGSIEEILEGAKCDWCGAPAGEILEEQTPLEKMVYEMYGLGREDA
jgi:hypothetical protein